MSWVAADGWRVAIGAFGILAGGFALVAGEPLAVVRSAFAALIAVSLLVAVAVVARGHPGWVVLSHLAISAGGASLFAYSVFQGRPVGLNRA